MKMMRRKWHLRQSDRTNHRIVRCGDIVVQVQYNVGGHIHELDVCVGFVDFSDDGAVQHEGHRLTGGDSKDTIDGAVDDISIIHQSEHQRTGGRVFRVSDHNATHRVLELIHSTVRNL